MPADSRVLEDAEVNTAAPPLVSIGIPTYNRAQKADRAIRSALLQTYEAIEVVVSDNASTDGTEDICRQLVRDNPRMRYTRQATNRGARANFDIVRDISRGEFFM